HVNLVEPQDGIEVVDAGNVKVMDFRLDGVADIAAQQLFQPGRGEIALQHWGPHIYSGFKVRPIETAGFESGRDAARQQRWKLFRPGVKRLPRRDFGT